MTCTVTSTAARVLPERVPPHVVVPDLEIDPKRSHGNLLLAMIHYSMMVVNTRLV
jgi:hypothetical protein